jgi:hypothetical protein
MQLIIIGLTLIIVLTFLFVAYHAFYVNHRSQMRIENKLKTFKPLIDKLFKKENIEEGDVISLAKNPSTRHVLFGILEEYGRTELFPHEYYTTEKGAESFLVNWLEFPTELNATPEKIEFVTTITVIEPANPVDYFVFKYTKLLQSVKTDEVWMLGVAGPYTPTSKPYDIPLRVFSRFNVAGTVNPLEEVTWVHQNIAKAD